jgi:hypothetical protein
MDIFNREMFDLERLTIKRPERIEDILSSRIAHPPLNTAIRMKE